MSNENAYSRRTFLKATGAGAATAAVAGCFGGDGNGEGNGNESGNGNGNGNGNGEDSSASDNDLRLINSTVSSLDPIQSTDTASGIIIGQVYENLTHYPNGEAEVENQLAEEVEISDDLLTYTFTIKEAQYHDGSELTAADFKYAWRRLAESEESQRANFVTDMLGIEAEVDDEGVVTPDSLAVEAVDDRTLEVTIADPEPAALDILAYDSFAAMPEGLVDDIEGYDDAEYTQEDISTDVMVGTGPFEYDLWEPGTEARVAAFDDYHGEAASVDGVHWQILEDDDAIWTYVNEQNADVFGIPTPFYEPDNIDAEEDDQGRQVGTYGPLENEEEVNYLGVAEMSTFYVAFNAAQTPKPVRQAIAYVTDHSELIENVFKERGEEAYSFTPPGMWPTGNDEYNSYVDEWPYSANETDRDSARQVLEEAGYTEDDPFELTITTYENEAFQEFATLTRDKVAGLGIDLSIETAEFGTLISRGEDGDLGFYSLGWIWSWVDPAYGHFGFNPENTNTDNMPGEANGYYLDWQEEDSEEMQKAADAWETIENNPSPDDEDIRAEAHVEIEEAVRDDMILLPLFHNLNERFWYDHVDIPETGPLGGHRQQYNTVTLDR
ncbi:ABC transporter substrate-binding protein [Natronosalvus halobius]|uniref:ABC transporter substrate-binding protein n=1 Tax=Natronosalvus halobius TaxID=2953746 RepID=UPI0020A03505|nr:ABC transporter substrate-binding protein [Natronosalvus halobius]USZ72775.1 ABC transporter substrate-binding protein [Natronosalvus halobius]